MSASHLLETELGTIRLNAVAPLQNGSQGAVFHGAIDAPTEVKTHSGQLLLAKLREEVVFATRQAQQSVIARVHGL